MQSTFGETEAPPKPQARGAASKAGREAKVKKEPKKRAPPKARTAAPKKKAAQHIAGPSKPAPRKGKEDSRAAGNPPTAAKTETHAKEEPRPDEPLPQQLIIRFEISDEEREGEGGVVAPPPRNP